MSILESLFRDKIGITPKSEVYTRHIQVYQKIIDDKEMMEHKAILDLARLPQWQVVVMKESQLAGFIKNGNISLKEWIKLNNEVDRLKSKVVSDYIDGQNSDTIYGIIKDGLERLKNSNINLLNMDLMKFGFWKEIVASAELAQLTILKIVNSDVYVNDINNDKMIKDYKVRKSFKR